MLDIFELGLKHGLKLLERLRLQFSYLNEHKFGHIFKDTINPISSCGFESKASDHYILRYKIYTDLRLYIYI